MNCANYLLPSILIIVYFHFERLLMNRHTHKNDLGFKSSLRIGVIVQFKIGNFKSNRSDFTIKVIIKKKIFCVLLFLQQMKGNERTSIQLRKYILLKYKSEHIGITNITLRARACVCVSVFVLLSHNFHHVQYL